MKDGERVVRGMKEERPVTVTPDILNILESLSLKIEGE